MSSSINELPRSVGALRRKLSLVARQGRQSQEGEAAVPCLSQIFDSDQLVNTQSLQPAGLPLEIKAFTKLPVVITSRPSGPGKPLSSYALLFCTVNPATGVHISPRLNLYGEQANSDSLIGSANPAPGTAESFLCPLPE